MNPDMLSFDEAYEKLLGFVRPVREVEEVDTLFAAGRVLAVDQHSTIDQPPMDNSGMDGYALRAVDVPVAGTRLPVSQRIPAGSVGHELAPGTAARIFTGAPLPPGADTVVMQELCEHAGDEVVVNTVPRAGEAVRRMGEDVARGARVLPAGLRLSPQAVALAASVGLARLPVHRRVKVAVFSTGSELVMPGEPLPPGGIYNSNRYLLRGLLAGLGCEVEDFGIVPDRLDATREVLRRAAEGHDLILTSGGVSVGEEDHVKPAVEAEGSLDMWKIAMKPGKPLAYGRVHGAAFIGLPGNPVSSFVTFLLMVRPFLLATQGVSEVAPASMQLRADFDWPRPDRRREFLRARMNAQGGVELFANQGSAALESTVWANGLVDIPAGTVIACGETVRFLPYGDLLH
ncbi:MULTISPECIES: molybdopterin molybdotransferase MoeA [Thauera]|jgi:molybdopterin molybdotransferase|uniref:Molybdopterin molybdenumtransferase n=1 Tax=Thauera aminoaromatica TaxID=164330 RepID=C4K9Q1_THASP|nr:MULTISPECIES: gephyrin-like molybdotransferase Glp [Thauera]ACR01127.1 molybdenum cofactor synthesis domain protein [Thauera aminoaromatica]OPZ06246.1 MAG: Molybdopterin molybdenumtransferase [Alphaproteobacteria bacterium ADurb.BinA305]HPV60435.1 molybdopterin molybdotransferase MoeA [Thauera aminoaromatica]HRG71921.1 molybdopterin molybdotransferase MoeA [Thauera aminoaromatica]